MQAQQRRLLAVEFNTIRSAREWMTAICGPHQLDVRCPRDLLFRHGGAALPDLSVGMIQYSTCAHIRTEDLCYSYSISLPIQGTQHFERGKQQLESNPQTGLILSPGHPIHLTLNEDCHKYLVRLSRAAVEAKLEKLLNRRVVKPVIFQPGMRLQGGIQDWWKLIAQLHMTLNQSNSLFDFADVWRSFQESLITGLLYAQPHNYSHELQHLSQHRPAYLLDLEQFMRDSIGSELNLDDLERAVGISRERLYRDFRQSYHCTPMSYFRNLRFQAVRERLLDAPSNANVSSIAMDCGFTQLGRFAHEYQERFGELPSDTLRKAQTDHLGKLKSYLQ